MSFLDTIRKSLESATPNALGFAKREFVRAREDLRKVYGRTWSDMGNL
jgi:hypothetical protein